MRKKYAIGVDVGGSHISSILVDVRKGRVVRDSYSEYKVNNQASANEIIQIWAKTIQKTIDYADLNQIDGIGFAMPGPFDYKNGIALLKGVAKYDSLYGLNIGNELKKVLHLSDAIPFRYINDAMSFAIGETWSGKGAGFDKVVAITLGTGFGSAFVTNGVPVLKGNNVPSMGYVYNIPYENGIADDYFSTRWFVHEYEKRTGEKCHGVKEIADKAEDDKIAKELFIDFGQRLGEFLSPLLKNFNANCLVIGGNISKAYYLFGPCFEEVLKKQCITIDISVSELMETAAMVGGARLIDNDFWLKTQPLVSNI
jgi:glucokinase